MCIGLSHFHFLPFKYFYGAKCFIYINLCTFHVKENSARLQWYSCARYKAPGPLVFKWYHFQFSYNDFFKNSRIYKCVHIHCTPYTCINWTWFKSPKMSKKKKKKEKKKKKNLPQIYVMNLKMEQNLYWKSSKFGSASDAFRLLLLVSKTLSSWVRSVVKFFTRTSLLKSSNNLEPICNDVNIKCSWLLIFRIISVTSTFTLWETYTTSVNLTNLKLIIFPIPLHSTIYSALFSLSLSTTFVV